MTALFGGAPEQAPRWDPVDTESCGGGIRFLGALWYTTNIWVFMELRLGLEVPRWAHKLIGRPLGRAPCLMGPPMLLRRPSSSYIYPRTPKRPETEQKP